MRDLGRRLVAVVRAVDPWDVLGVKAVSLIGAGIWRLAGWPWASIFSGAVLVGLYILHELQLARATARRRED